MMDEIKTTRKINIIVAIEIFCNADQQEVIEQCNYTFEHDDIVGTEILGETQ